MSGPDELRNPYWSSANGPQLKPSVVAYIDILGYKEAIQEAEANNSSEQLLEKLHAVLSTTYNYVLPSDSIIIRALNGKDRYKVRTFTDNVVIGQPIVDIEGFSKAEWELNDFIHMLSCFQTEMVNAGFFVRGAISIGNLYMDDIVVYGQGLVDAYEGESEYARDPRIILTKSAQQAINIIINEHINWRGSSPIVNSIYKDADGQFFLNYLDYRIFIAESDLGPDFNAIIKHKNAIESMLIKHRSSPSLWSKYAWTAYYHNFFCNHHDCFGNNHRVDVSKYQIQPGLITDGLNAT